jgi:hypothetical protein
VGAKQKVKEKNERWRKKKKERKHSVDGERK